MEISWNSPGILLHEQAGLITMSTAPQHHVTFPPFRLDRTNGRLWRGSQEILLRPKTLAVLCLLVERAGRLVTRDDLVHVVWQGAAGGAELPRGCVRELRRALGDDAAASRFIETVGRRGYRFVADVGTAPRIAPASVTAAPSASASVSLLVGRERARAALARALDDARGGVRRLVFVTGEPGIGKSALLQVFLADVAAAGAVVAQGRCVEHHGGGDPYHPVLEALARLGRDPAGERLVDILARHAPTWMIQLPGLADERTYEAAERRARGATPDRMLREIGDALEVLTATTPLVLALDDLQWSDPATVALLAALPHRRGPECLLIVGTYRPADLVESDHPLKGVKQELQGRGLCDELPLGFLAPGDVATYLAARFPGHRFPDDLAGAIHGATEGSPLFMVNVLADLVARARITADASGWRLEGPAASVATEVPESLRQLIDRRLDRVGGDALAVLEAASVAGHQFGAVVVAAATDLGVPASETECEVLARDGHFLDALGACTLPDGTTTGRYEFRHTLYQKALYERIAPARRTALHRCIGERMEAMWGARAPEVAADLAGHFECAGDLGRAVRYRIDATETARRRQAHREMMMHLMRGLDLVHALPEGMERAHSELLLQAALARSLIARRGYAAPEVERALERARALSGDVPDPGVLFPIVRGRHGLHLVRGAFREARDLARQCAGLAETVGAPALRLEADLAVGESAFYLGDLEAARTSLERALRIAARERPPVPAFRAGSDPRIACHAHLGFTRWVLGESRRALHEARAAIALAEKLMEPLGQALALVAAAIVHQFRREAAAAQGCAEQAATIAVERGFAMFSAQASVLAGWARAAQGAVEAGVRVMREGLEAWEATGAAMARPYYLSLIAEGLAASGSVRAAATLVDDALATAMRTGESWWLAELHRQRGELRLLAGAPTVLPADQARTRADAEVCFRTAIDTAARQGAGALELRATVSLAQLWRRRRGPRARALLRDALGRVAGARDSPDVRAAEALLVRLGH